MSETNLELGGSEFETKLDERTEKWKKDIEKLLSVSLTHKTKRPIGESNRGVNFDSPVFYGRLSDGKQVLIQVYPAGHYFGAEIYDEEGNYASGSNDYTWDEFQNSLNNPANFKKKE